MKSLIIIFIALSIIAIFALSLCKIAKESDEVAEEIMRQINKDRARED